MSRSLLVLLAGLSLPLSAVAQRSPPIDVLTGEPMRPPSRAARNDPEIFNAPHAPKQAEQGSDLSMPLDILVAPETGMEGRARPGPGWRYP